MNFPSGNLCKQKIDGKREFDRKKGICSYDRLTNRNFFCACFEVQFQNPSENCFGNSNLLRLLSNFCYFLIIKQSKRSYRESFMCDWYLHIHTLQMVLSHSRYTHSFSGYNICETLTKEKEWEQVKSPTAIPIQCHT